MSNEEQADTLKRALASGELQGFLALRGFLARVLGWMNELAIESALRSIEFATAHRAQLVLCGAGDLVPIACALHRRTHGADRPFVLCDPCRGNTPASVRAPANHRSGVAAIAAAAGGSLCVRSARPPEDFSSMLPHLRNAGDVQYIVCCDEDEATHPLLVRPAPIQIPSLKYRGVELPRIVDEYAQDAIALLGVCRACFTERDRAWVVAHEASSFSEIEKTTLRLVALKASANTRIAAQRLGMAGASLGRWARHRNLLETRSGRSRSTTGSKAPLITKPHVRTRKPRQ
jgi:hypothetical protein